MRHNANCPNCGCKRTYQNTGFAWCVACSWIKRLIPTNY